MIISRLLIIALGVLWILLLLIVGGALGVDAASVPVTEAYLAAPTFAVAPPGDDGQIIRAADDGNWSERERSGLLEQGLAWHRTGEFGEAAAVYSRLLEVSRVLWQRRLHHRSFHYCLPRGRVVR